jgi:signal transduction histidine kinase
VSSEGLRKGADPWVAGALAAAALHDLSNLLAVARTSAHLASSSLEDHAFVARHLEKIARKLDEAEALARRLLAVARGERVVAREVTLEEVLAAGARDLSVPSGVTLELAAGAGATCVACEVFLLGRAIADLVDNAFAAIRDSGVGRVVVVDASATEAGTTIWICDDGPGLSPEVAFANVTSKPGGSGLGLLVARAIAQAHGGTLQLKRRAPYATALELFVPKGSFAPGD